MKALWASSVAHQIPERWLIAHKYITTSRVFWRIRLTNFHAVRLSSAGSLQVRRSFGGVGRNIAVALNSLRAASTAFVTAVGSDEVGQEAVANLARLGVHTDTVLRREGFSTATYVAVHSADGDMAVAIADTSLYDASPLLPLLTLPSTFVSAK